MVCQNLFLSDIFTVFIPLFVLRSSSYIVTFCARSLVGVTPHVPPLHTIHYTLGILCILNVSYQSIAHTTPIYRWTAQKYLIHATQYIQTRKSYKIQYTYVAVAMEYSGKMPCVESQDGIIRGAYGCFLLLEWVACLLGEK
jgi:hypothetical protein